MHTKFSSFVALPSLAMQEETKIEEGIQANEDDDGGGDAASSRSITPAATAAVVAARTHQTTLCTTDPDKDKKH